MLSGRQGKQLAPAAALHPKAPATTLTDCVFSHWGCMSMLYCALSCLHVSFHLFLGMMDTSSPFSFSLVRTLCLLYTWATTCLTRGSVRVVISGMM